MGAFFPVSLANNFSIFGTLNLTQDLSLHAESAVCTLPNLEAPEEEP